MKLALRLALVLTLIATTALAVASMATAATAPAPTGFFNGNINSCGTGDKSVEAVLDVAGPWNGANSGSWPATQVSGDGLAVTISNVTTVGGKHPPTPASTAVVTMSAPYPRRVVLAADRHGMQRATGDSEAIWGCCRDMCRASA